MLIGNNMTFYPYGEQACPPRIKPAKVVRLSYRQRLSLIVHAAVKANACKVWV